VGISTLTTYLIQQTGTHFQASAPATLLSRLPVGSNAICLSPEALAKVPPLVSMCGSVVASAIDDTFFAAMIVSAACIALALLLGSDPVVVARRQAYKHGEAVEAAPVQQPALVGE